MGAETGTEMGGELEKGQEGMQTAYPVGGSYVPYILPLLSTRLSRPSQSPSFLGASSVSPLRVSRWAAGTTVSLSLATVCYVAVSLARSFKSSGGGILSP